MTRIVHISDLHFPGIELGAAEALVEAVRGMEPDLVVVSGDLTMRGRRREFVEARAFLDRIERPMLVVPGNHDIPVDPLRRFIRPMARFRRWISDDLTPTHVTDGMCVLGLNTARPWDLSWNWSHGRFSAAQVEEADSFFGSQASCPFRCLVMHHPFFLPEDGLKGFRIVGRATEMLRVLARRRVDLVLAGHLHRGFWRAHEEQAEEGARHVLVVQASTATSLRRRGEANAFNVLDFSGDSMTLTAWVRDDGAFGARGVTRFARTQVGWSALDGPLERHG